MIYRCENEQCDYWGESTALPEKCPLCGAALEPVAEQAMTGDDWAALGSGWMDCREEAGKARMVECFRRAAYLGSAWGTCNLGICLEQGIGVEADARQAFWLYQQAMEMGSLNAVCCLGVCHEYGIGTQKNEQIAAAYYKMAAEHGSPRGQLLLSFEREALLAEGFDLTTPVVVSNGDEFAMEKAQGGEVRPGDTIITLTKRA